MSLKGALRGINAIKAKAEEKKSFSGDGTGAFLQLKDGEAAKIRFLQELDEASPDYNDRRGLITVVEEHVSPKDFKKRAVCTYEEEGRCWACEQTVLPEIGKKWRSKMRMYANVLVRAEDGDKVKILAQGFGDKNIGGDVVNIAEEFGALGDKDCKLSRKGSGMNDTNYSLLPLAPKKLTKEEQELDLIDVTKFVNYVAYENQASFFTGNSEESGGPEAWA